MHPASPLNQRPIAVLTDEFFAAFPPREPLAALTAATAPKIPKSLTALHPGITIADAGSRATALDRCGIPLDVSAAIPSGSLAAMLPVARGDFLRVTTGDIGGCSIPFP